jgi:hypothetical protein
MNLIRKSLFVALAVGAASIFLSWSYIFYVRPFGHLEGPIVFVFSDESNKPIAKTITSFVVSERTSEGLWRPVWALDGRGRFKDIKYGAKCAGLKETVAAKKLAAGKVYGAFASDGSGGSGGGPYFGFKQNGSMVFSNSPDALP